MMLGNPTCQLNCVTAVAEARIEVVDYKGDLQGNRCGKTDVALTVSDRRILAVAVVRADAIQRGLEYPEELRIMVHPTATAGYFESTFAKSAISHRFA
jgi:hypothetical protein